MGPSLRKFAIGLFAVGLLLAGVVIGLTRLGQWVANVGGTPVELPPAASPMADAAAPASETRTRRRTPPPPPPPTVNAAGEPVCVPKTCMTEEADCGTIPDGCGGTVDCGGCEEGYECGGKTSHMCIFKCEPLSCKEVFATCGEVDDGCGHTIKCGSCAKGETCGGGGIANECGKGLCQPFSCRQRDLVNGRFSDGCGGVLDC